MFYWPGAKNRITWMQMARQDRRKQDTGEKMLQENVAGK
jgi:hypothetical protein